MKTLAILLVFAACSHKNDNYCPGANPDNNCLEDAASDGSGSNQSCPAIACATGVCDTTSHMCVECLTDATCAGVKPVCGGDEMCHGCTSDAACTQSNTCLPDGSCADVAVVLYASTTGSGTATCASSDACSLDHAVSLLDTTHTIIHLAPGTYPVVGIALAKDATLVGRGAILDKSSGPNGPVIATVGKHLTLDYLTAQSGDDPLIGHGVACSGGGTVVLHSATLQNNQANGLSASACTVTIDRSTIYNNNQGGITLIGSGINFDITNTFVIRNGNLSDAPFGGINIVPTSIGTARLEFNTIVDNVAVAGATHFGGVLCDVVGFNASNNIIARNTKGGAASQTLGACSYPTSKVQDDIVGLSFLLPDAPPFNYKIDASSTAMDQATTASSVDVDVDGTHRPMGAAKDIGAYEVH